MAAGPLAVLLAACTPGSEKEGGSGEAVDGLPSTVEATPQWSAQSGAGAPVRLTPLGVLTLAAGEEPETVAPTLLDLASGEHRWQGEPVPTGDGVALHWVTRDGRPWVVLVATTGTEVTVYVWDGSASAAADNQFAPISTNTYAGADAAPVVTVSGSGILVAGVEGSGPFVVIPDTGETTLYGGGPERDGEPGTPVAYINGGFLVTLPGGGFSYATPSGGWRSDAVAPDGAEPATATMLDYGGGYIVALWPLTDDTDAWALAVHSLADGRVVAQHPITVAEADEARGREHGVILDPSARMLAWGTYVFDVTTGEGAALVLNGATPTALVESILYGTGAAAPLGVATETSDGGGSDAGGAGAFNGKVALDVTTSLPLPNTYTVTVHGLSTMGQMVMSRADGTLISSRLR